MSSGDPSAATEQGASSAHRPLDAVWLLFVALAALVLWFSAADHPLYTPDEGRYASASRVMAEGGSWLVPTYEGRPHLTKPPLTYWLQALCMRVFGPTEGAARAPSLLAATLTLLLTAWFAARLWGRRVGTIAACLLSVTPLFLVMGRLASTDALLTLFWTVALVAGALHAVERRKRWLTALWLGTALAVMTKGPLGLVPVGLLVVWHALAGRWRAIAALWIPLGLPLALLPAVGWAAMVIRQQPQALEIWRHETLDRAAGSGDHPKPLWFYIPIFLGGLFPASAMLRLPGLNDPLRSLGARLRRGDIATLLGLAVWLPFVMFSLIAGKLPSYLLPMAPPLAVATALAVDALLPRSAVQTGGPTLARFAAPRRPPAVTLGLLIGAVVMATAAIGGAAALAPAFLPQAIVFALLPPVIVWTNLQWRREPALRQRALVVAWLAFVASWLWAFEVEDEVRTPSNAATLVQEIRLATAPAEPVVHRFGFRDPTITFYLGRELVRIADDDGVPIAAQGPRDRVVVLADEDRWRAFSKRHPAQAKRWRIVSQWIRWPNDRVLVLRPKEPEPPAGDQGPSATQPSNAGAVSTPQAP